MARLTIELISDIKHKIEFNDSMLELLNKQLAIFDKYTDESKKVFKKMSIIEILDLYNDKKLMESISDYMSDIISAKQEFEFYSAYNEFLKEQLLKLTSIQVVPVETLDFYGGE